MSESVYEYLRRKKEEHPLLDWGVCDIERAADEHPASFSLFPSAGEYRRAIVVALPLPSGAFDGLSNAPTPLYLHHYRQLNYILDRIAYSTALLLERLGERAVAAPASQYVSLHPQPRGILSHRVLAYYAGLGFIGRSRLLVHREFGPRARLVSILTTADIKPNRELQRFDCADCRDCIAACPAGAIGESPSDYDIDRCFAKLQEFRKVQFVGQHICGICIKVCPFSNIPVQKYGSQET